MSMKMCKLRLEDANGVEVLSVHKMYEIHEEKDKSYIILGNGKTFYLRHKAFKDAIDKYFYSKEEFRILQLNKLV